MITLMKSSRVLRKSDSSLLVALIDRKINQYIAKIDGIVKKMEKDKYFIVIKKKYFQQLKEDKFALLEEVKGISIGNEMPATLSSGLFVSTTTTIVLSLI